MTRLMTRADVQDALSCSKTYALQVMHMFEARGQLLRNGKMMWIKASSFEDWLKEMEKVSKLRGVIRV